METAALHVLAKENRRLADDLLRLTAPRRLNAAQKQQYHALLQQKSNGFMMTAARFEQQWQANGRKARSAKWNETFRPPLRKFSDVLKSEIQILSANAPENARARLQRFLREQHGRPSQREIMMARLDLQKDPFDRSKIEHFENWKNKPAK